MAAHEAQFASVSFMLPTQRIEVYGSQGARRWLEFCFAIALYAAQEGASARNCCWLRHLETHMQTLLLTPVSARPCFINAACWADAEPGAND